MSDMKNGINQENGKVYWTSYESLNTENQDPAVYNEFMPGVKDEFSPEKLSGISRRKFLALLGASAAMAATGCTDYRDKGKIVSYNKKPEEITFGEANYYASTCTSCGNTCGILIKTREGKPIKVDGNPDHPISKGKICTRCQASVMDLYDPARFRAPQEVRSGSTRDITWAELDKAVLNALKSGGKAVVFSHAVVSPSYANVLSELKEKYPNLEVVYYDQFNEEIKRSAWKKSYGTDLLPVIDWKSADLIVSIEADILGSEGNPVEQTREITARRDAHKKNFNRLYSVEGNFSLTSISADSRIRLNPALHGELVYTLLNEVSKSVKSNLTEGLNLDAFTVDALASKGGLSAKEKKALSAMVKDLIANRGKGIVYAGRALSEEIHIAVNILNEILGNTALYNKENSNVSLFSYATKEELEKVIGEIKSGSVGLVINADCNPVYDLASDYGFADALKKAGLVVTLTALENETTAASKYIGALSHGFESWGDAQTRTGIHSLKQPVIEPLYKTRQLEAILLNWAGGNPDAYSDTMYHDYVKANWEKTVYSAVKTDLSFERFWLGALHDGVVLTREAAEKKAAFKPEAAKSLNPQAKKVNGYTLLLLESYALGDGRHANNGWLQELPHPISKVTWDNYLSVSVNTSKELGLKTGSMAEVTVGSRKLKLPVLIQPGMAEKTVSVSLGYGRTNSPAVAVNVGQNANLLQSKNNASPWLYENVSVTKTDGNYKLASTQDHYVYDDTLIKDLHVKRDLVREGTVDEYEKDPHFLHHGKKHELLNMYKEYEYKDVKWGMNIDLGKCTGCGQCVVACDIENNVPVVGKDQVLIGREMHWLRIDRYYAGDPNEPASSVTPMMCQHCDQAPCENVCPVVATTHSPDGLNQMVYNRCVGTRYCSNNCPYKVRRFNFFDFRDHFADGFYYQEPVNLGHNPEVTVRSRGVMEKCTFCVHRIEDARATANAAGKTFTGEGVTTACQDACPANAITFGNYNAKESEFAKLNEHELGYALLEELNIRPNIKYLAKLRNTAEGV